MTKFIINRFVLKNDLSDFELRQRYAYVSSIVGIFCNILLSVLKIACGVIFNTISILGDGLNNLSDAISSVITLVGFKISEKPADKKHPFGHARMEYVSGFTISFLITFVGCELILSTFRNDFKPVFSTISIAILIISIVSKLWLYVFNKKIAETIKSKTILATAKDSLNDVFITFGVLVTSVIYEFLEINLDSIVAIILGVIIIKFGIEIIREMLSLLIGEAPDKDFIKFIYEEISKFDNVLSAHDLIVHSYGYSKSFVSIHIEMDVEFGFLESHEVAEQIENYFKEKEINIVIHVDPVILNSKENDEYKQIVLNILEKIDSRLTMHDFRAVFKISQKKLSFDVVLPNDLDMTENELTQQIKREIFKIDDTIYVEIQIDCNYNDL
ncbi:MAG: cation diffusion facilitator family transporter [Clostridia bacterium]